MIKMLAVGGVELLTDNLRLADENNPNGYYEFERVKKLKDGDIEWVGTALGKSVKVISALLQSLPADYEYRVIFMQRDIREVLASQQKMLVSRGELSNQVSDEQLAQIYQNHLQNVEIWMKEQPNVRVLYVNYNQLLKNHLPELKQVNEFLDGRLDVEEMAKVVDKNLYRQRQS